MLNRKNIVKMLGIGSLCLFLLGCSEESFLVQKESSTVILEEEVMLSQQENEEWNMLQKNQKNPSETEIKDSEEEKSRIEDREEENNSESGITKEKTEGNAAGNQSVDENIVVHICGAVKNPGVYDLQKGQRLYEGISDAGGFREDADEEYLNQALILEDGMKIVIPTKEETLQKRAEEKNTGNANNSDRIDADMGEKTNPYMQSEECSEVLARQEGYLEKQEEISESNGVESNPKVDLNTADVTLLCTLPGIGESRASSIVAYREEHGPFQKKEDVMKVSGIKEAAYRKIKDYIRVSE